jgi:uncharacterized membrane protein YhhN
MGIMITLVSCFAFCLIARQIAVYKNSLFFKYLFTPLVTAFIIGVALNGMVVSGISIFNILILCGLIVDAIADTLLMIEEVNLFKHGIIYFLIGNGLYIFAMSPVYIFQIWHIGIFIGLLMIIIQWIWVLRKNSLEVSIPIIIYMLVLCTMVGLSWGFTYQIELPVGITLFLISDIILAVNIFVKPIQNSSIYTWMFYAPGQMLIALSCYYM